MDQPQGSLFRLWLMFTLFVPATALVSASILILRPLGLMSARTSERLIRWWCRVALWTSGGRVVSVEGSENLPPQGGFILAPNHNSYLDISALTALLPVKIRYLAKAELFKIPLMGQAMTTEGYIPVDREDSSRALGLLKNAARRIHDGAVVVVFPEGTRNPDPARGLLEFKKGAFFLSRLSGCPIVPVAIEGTFRLMPKNRIRPEPGPIRIKIGEPLDPAAFGRDVDRLMDATRKALTDLVAELKEGS